MTHKYEGQCWSCGSRDMEDMGDYVRCRKCGATWNEAPTLSAQVVTEVDLKTGKAPSGRNPTRFRPSRLVQRRADRARSRQ